jgi:hypothetical protein
VARPGGANPAACSQPHNSAARTSSLPLCAHEWTPSASRRQARRSDPAASVGSTKNTCHMPAAQPGQSDGRQPRRGARPDTPWNAPARGDTAKKVARCGTRVARTAARDEALARNKPVTRAFVVAGTGVDPVPPRSSAVRRGSSGYQLVSSCARKSWSAACATRTDISRHAPNAGCPRDPRGIVTRPRPLRVAAAALTLRGRRPCWSRFDFCGSWFASRASTGHGARNVLCLRSQPTAWAI